MEKKPLFIHSKIYYFITEALVGLCLMGIEMSASRLISVYFSSSQVVWTLIIGVIMIAMAAGNYWGGKQADKKPSYLRLYLELSFAGVYIILIPFLGKYVIVGVSVLFALFITHNLVIWAALFSCIILFVPPLLFLGKVTPSLIKYAMGEKVSGKVIGLLEALNTVGSILGTFLPTFLTIPFIGTSNSFVLFGGLIALVGLLYVITSFIEIYKNKPRKEEVEVTSTKDDKKEKRRFIRSIVLTCIYSATFTVGMIFSINASFTLWEEKGTIKETESTYNYLKVYRQDNATYLSTNILFGVQSMIKDDDSLTGMYYDYLLSSKYLVKDNPEILILGNGTGTYATMMKNYMNTNCHITAIEIDQKIIDLSYEYFHMNPTVNVICDDGRNFLARTNDKYDIILVDAYTSISAPFHMTTVEFFTFVKNHLNYDGLMMMNINMNSDTPGSMSHTLCDTAISVFGNLYTIGKGTGVEVFAYNGVKDVKQELENVASIKEDYQSVIYEMTNEITGLKRYQDTGYRLYDDNADIEMRSMNALDELIVNLLGDYIKILKEQGISGLINSLK